MGTEYENIVSVYALFGISLILHETENSTKTAYCLYSNKCPISNKHTLPLFTMEKMTKRLQNWHLAMKISYCLPKFCP